MEEQVVEVTDKLIRTKIMIPIPISDLSDQSDNECSAHSPARHRPLGFSVDRRSPVGSPSRRCSPVHRSPLRRSTLGSSSRRRPLGFPVGRRSPVGSPSHRCSSVHRSPLCQSPVGSPSRRHTRAAPYPSTCPRSSTFSTPPASKGGCADFDSASLSLFISGERS